MRLTTRRGILGALVLLFGSFPLGLQAEPLPRLIVFGDSLSDPGNAFVLLGHQQATAPYTLIPEAPYAIGGHHFTNGATWIEQLARRLAVSMQPAYAVAGGTNFAVGGSRARNVGVIHLSSQVSAYQYGLGLRPDDQLVFMIGANDLRDAIEALAADPSGLSSQQILTDALISLQTNIMQLLDSGIRQVFISNAPDLSLLPAIRQQGPAAIFAAHLLSQQFNQQLLLMVKGLAAHYPAQLTYFDLFSLVSEVAQSPQAYGFRNATDTCITPGVIIRAICPNPRRYLFWDGIHPTRHAHAIVARQARQAFVHR